MGTQTDETKKPNEDEKPSRLTASEERIAQRTAEILAEKKATSDANRLEKTFLQAACAQYSTGISTGSTEAPPGGFAPSGGLASHFYEIGFTDAKKSRQEIAEMARPDTRKGPFRDQPESHADLVQFFRAVWVKTSKRLPVGENLREVGQATEMLIACDGDISRAARQLAALYERRANGEEV